MTIRTELLTTTAMVMTPAERSKGRFMRAPDDHGGTPAPSPAPAPAPSPAPAADAEPEDTRTDEEVLNDEFESPAEEALADDEGEDAPVKEEPKPGESPVEERIGELTRQAREADRAAAEARRDADEWRRKAEAAEQPPKGDDVDPDAAPAPEDYEFGEADSKYIADLAVHAARQEVRTQAEAAEVKAMFTDMEAKWTGEIAKPEVVEKYPDFDEKVVKGATDQKWDCSPAMAVGIKQSPVGVDVAYHLASNPDEASRISKLPLMDQVLAFGRIEGRYLAAQEAAKTEPVPVTPTKAPNPPAARARGAGGQFATEPDTEDFGAFDKMADGLIRHKG